MDPRRTPGEHEPRSAHPPGNGPERSGLARGTRRRRSIALGAIVACIALVAGAAMLAPASPRRRHRAQGRAAGQRRAPARAATPTTGAPLGPAEQRGENRRILSYTSYLSRGTARKRELALSFDDGPGPYTSSVLRVLERFHAKATFFEIGRQVSEFPQLTASLSKAGMVIGDHTEEHPSMTRLDRASQAIQLDEASNAIQDAGAPAPLLFRPPYGAFDSTTLRLLRARDMVMVLWSVDTSDYALPGVKRIVASALAGAKPGAVILMHDGGGNRAQTVAALPRIIERLRARGYSLVTVPELLRDDPPPAGQPPPVSLSGD